MYTISEIAAKIGFTPNWVSAIIRTRGINHNGTGFRGVRLFDDLSVRAINEIIIPDKTEKYQDVIDYYRTHKENSIAFISFKFGMSKERIARIINRSFKQPESYELIESRLNYDPTL